MSSESVEATLFREKLYEEEPKMDAALKSYCSWLLAQQHGTQYQKHEVHHLSEDDAVQVQTSHTWEMTEVLGLARKLSKSINSYVFDIRLDESTERSIVAQVWNELAAMSTNNNNNSSSSKPSAAGVRITKMLGQTALMFAWKDLDRSDLLPLINNNKAHAAQVDEQQDEGQQEQHEAARLFLETFERFLFANATVEATASTAGGADTFNDAQLIWSPDGGKAELSRRASQRQKEALERRQQEEESQRGLGLLQLQQAMSGREAASTPTIAIIEEGEGKES
jgi:hypothetical protein